MKAPPLLAVRQLTLRKAREGLHASVNFVASVSRQRGDFVRSRTCIRFQAKDQYPLRAIVIEFVI